MNDRRLRPVRDVAPDGVITLYCPTCRRKLVVGIFVGWVEVLCPNCPKPHNLKTFHERAPQRAGQSS